MSTDASSREALPDGAGARSGPSHDETDSFQGVAIFETAEQTPSDGARAVTGLPAPSRLSRRLRYAPRLWRRYRAWMNLGLPARLAFARAREDVQGRRRAG
jgi:hypothetical protein